jgi:RecA/RadA recombinase
MSLMKKLMSNSKIKKTSILTESEVFTDKDVIQTDVPMINVALSGKLDGGLSPGLLVIAAESKHFKSSFALVLGSAFQKKYADGIILFYDTEFGMPQQYFKQFGIDTDRVVHVPITDVEELKHDIVNQLDNINRGEKVFIILDSLGNLASKKEVEDAMEGKSVADMSRAKQFKSLFRMVTPHLTLKDIPMVVINHVYKEIGTMFPKTIPGGGTGAYYSASDIWIIGRQQEKEKGSSEVAGFNFIINIEKSRTVKEKSKIPITVMLESGIEKWSGLFEVALAGEYIKEMSSGWFSTDGEKKRRRADIENDNEFWHNLLQDDKFKTFVQQKYSLVKGE